MNRKVVLLGFYVGDTYFAKYAKDDAFPQVAAYKLEGRFLQAIRSTGMTVSTVASMAVSTYPRNKRWFFPKERFVQADCEGIVTPIINLPLFKMVSRLLGSFFNLLKKSNSGIDIVCVYAAHTPNLLAAYLLYKLKGVPYLVYVADLPSYMDMGVERSFVVRILKRIDANIIDRLITASAGVFLISEHMAIDSAAWSAKKYLVIEGISDASVEPLEDSHFSSLDKNIVLYAGGLNKAYGVIELVEGFIKAKVDAELWICGRGELESYLVETASKHSSVKYLGFMSASEVERLQLSASCLILTRDPQQKYTRYSFPSKLLEYLASGVPVLTTRLDGIPMDYYKYINAIEDCSSDGISDAIKQFFSADQRLLLTKAALGKHWVLESKSSQAVGYKIAEFMEKI